MRPASMGIAAIVLLTALAWSRGLGDGKVAEAALATDIPVHGEQRAAELVALRARVARLEEQLTALQTVSTAGGASCAQASRPQSPAEPSLAALSEATPPVADLAATFDGDARAAQPTPHAAQLASRMKALLPQDASLDRLECRGQICRAELTLPGIKRYHEFIKRAFGDPDQRVWSGRTKFGFASEPDPQHWEQDEISVYAYLGPEPASPEL